MSFIFFYFIFSFLSLEHVKKTIPANCDAHLEESIFQTHSKYYQIQFQASPAAISGLIL
ncbi:DUF6783 domain-containing protein [Blautia wexlerae]|uniref:DUF6783 domain-containing protein n=1 Tax=Blautia wexlerae TaxID=418240 RepID=UPI003B502552